MLKKLFQRFNSSGPSRMEYVGSTLYKKTKIQPLEGSELDLNERPEVVAVRNFDIDGQSVDAALSTGDRITKLNARVRSCGKTLGIRQFDGGLTQSFEFETNSRVIKVETESDNDYVLVRIDNG